MGTYFASILRCATRSSKGFSRPRRQTFTPASETSARSKSNATPARPAAARMRPQLGSAPAMAVFTSGEFAMVGRAANFDFDYVPGAFAIGDDLQGERLADELQRGAEFLPVVI